MKELPHSSASGVQSCQMTQPLRINGRHKSLEAEISKRANPDFDRCANLGIVAPSLGWSLYAEACLRGSGFAAAGDLWPSRSLQFWSCGLSSDGLESFISALDGLASFSSTLPVGRCKIRGALSVQLRPHVGNNSTYESCLAGEVWCGPVTSSSLKT
eukprot:CAMPEP_0170573146 /NCGR_PEP_ID=MMETSP0224-20130122/2607_1 /TAXON_ID=285029 /ORGANISM="Togula jolla, Strain CCCM 725" /LENGTH=156 /DNA_ID=CAMNT_0010895709 /DNA_START=152 /DNA_END=623 /DNA_ORIENTATION=-